MFKIANENDINARHPMDLRYMKFVRLMLRMIDSWPHQQLRDSKPVRFRDSRYLFIEGAGVGIGGLFYVRSHYKVLPFLEIGQTYLTIFLSTVATQRVTIAWFKSFREVITEFVLKIHLFYFRHKTKYTENVYQRINRLCSIFVAFVAVEVTIGVFLFNLMPFLNNYKKGMFNQELPIGKVFEHSINYSLPYVDCYTNLIGYIVMTLINIICSYDCGMFFSGVDVCIAVIVFHIWGHLKILDHRLRTFPTPVQMRGHQSGDPGDDLMYTKEENMKAAAMLKDIIEYHGMIMRFMTKTSEAFGPTLCLYYVFHQVSGCILLLECSSLDPESLGRYAGLTVALFQLLIQVSVIVELLGTQSETLKDAVYSMPWECMDTSNRRTVLFLLHNVQEPIRLKPMGIVSIGVQTMATIIKTSFSYFMLLGTFT
uniref:Odorant receptor n=1 Tax=Ostrinia nubilalis TaxID=29057 RepID=D3J5H7_OSTNU|nr:odorant receptor 4 [Ostrinia nubilalis]